MFTKLSNCDLQKNTIIRITVGVRLQIHFFQLTFRCTFSSPLFYSLHMSSLFLFFLFKINVIFYFACRLLAVWAFLMMPKSNCKTNASNDLPITWEMKSLEIVLQLNAAVMMMVLIHFPIGEWNTKEDFPPYTASFYCSLTMATERVSFETDLDCLCFFKLFVSFSAHLA